jgi:hypothetical protein
MRKLLLFILISFISASGVLSQIENNEVITNGIIFKANGIPVGLSVEFERTDKSSSFLIDAGQSLSIVIQDSKTTTFIPNPYISFEKRWYTSMKIRLNKDGKKKYITGTYGSIKSSIIIQNMQIPVLQTGPLVGHQCIFLKKLYFSADIGPGILVFKDVLLFNCNGSIHLGYILN